MLKRSKNGLFPKKVEYLAKNINPANAPKLRPIENFWEILSAKVNDKDWSANNLIQLLEVPKPDWIPAEEMAMMHYNFI